MRAYAEAVDSPGAPMPLGGRLALLRGGALAGTLHHLRATSARPRASARRPPAAAPRAYVRSSPPPVALVNSALILSKMVVRHGSSLLI